MPPSVHPHGDIEDFQFIRRVVYGKIGDKLASFINAAGGKGRVPEGLAELFLRPGQGEAEAFQSRDSGRVARVKAAGNRSLRKARGKIMHGASPHSVSLPAPPRRRRASTSLPPAQAGSLPGELVEFFDEQDRLLLVAPAGEAARLGLRRMVVGVAVRLADDRLLVRRRPGGAGRETFLDLSGVAHLRPGEASEDAALRSLGRSVADPLSLRRVASFVLAAHNLRVTLFVAGPQRVPEEMAGTLAVDRDELEGIARAAPELLSPALLWSVRSGRLWPAERGGVLPEDSIRSRPHPPTDSAADG